MSYLTNPIIDRMMENLYQRQPLTLSVPWEEEVLFPSIMQHSLRNIPHTIADVLGVELPNHTPLPAWVWGDTPPKDIQRVVLFLADGMGYRYLESLMQEDAALAEHINGLTQGRGIIPLSSIAPTTTAVALPTLWTGTSAAEHGFLATTMYMREFATTVFTLGMRPTLGRHSVDALTSWGIDFADLIPVPGVAELLAQADVPSYQILERSLIGTGLSKILHRGLKRSYPHFGYDDIWSQLPKALQETRDERCFMYAYWGNIDGLGHWYGSHSDQTKGAIQHLFAQLQHVLADESLHDGRTLFILTADHGHMDAETVIDVATHKWFDRVRPYLRHHLCGDFRLPILHVQPGMKDEVKAILRGETEELFAVVDSQEALEGGLWGDYAGNPEVKHRMGDLLLIPFSGVQLTDTSTPSPMMVGMHSGFHEWEVLTPFMWRVL